MRRRLRGGRCASGSVGRQPSAWPRLDERTARLRALPSMSAGHVQNQHQLAGAADGDPGEERVPGEQLAQALHHDLFLTHDRIDLERDALIADAEHQQRPRLGSLLGRQRAAPGGARGT